MDQTAWASLLHPRVGVLHWDARRCRGCSIGTPGTVNRSQVLGVLCVPTEHVIYTFALALRSIRWELHKVRASRPPGGRQRKPTEKAP